MRTTGTIYADGRVQYHGYERMNSRLLSISETAMVIHHGGGSYSDNGGTHYVAACVEVKPIASLKPGNEEGTWLFEIGGERLGVRSFHPTPKIAAKEAMRELEYRGAEFSAAIEKRRKEQRDA